MELRKAVVCLNVIHYLSVTFFGMVLVIWFCNIKITIRTLAEFMGLGILGGLINLYVSIKLEGEAVYLFYPLTIHLPLLVFCMIRQKRFVWQSVFAITMAYMLTTPRKWLFEFLAHLCGGTVVVTIV
ncbi:MAG: hypothetical protein RR957_05485, partial [Oscillospiraceae bacterium]